MRAFPFLITCAITTTLAAPALAQVAPSADPSSSGTETRPAGPSSPINSDDPSAAAGAAGDIVVTARRVNERLQDVPLAVSAVTGATLQREGVSELVDLTATVPSLKV